MVGRDQGRRRDGRILIDDGRFDEAFNCLDHRRLIRVSKYLVSHSENIEGGPPYIDNPT